MNSHGRADEILSSWCEVINDSFESLDIADKRIGIAMPGPFDYVDGICLIRDQEKFQGLYQLNIKKELAGRLNITASNIEFITTLQDFHLAFDCFFAVLGKVKAEGKNIARKIEKMNIYSL